jgi:hypothetical protein
VGSLVILISSSGCGSARAPVGSTIVVSAAGRVGALRVDQSTRAAVVALAGKPDAERHGRAPGGYAPYDALGYGCAGNKSSNGAPLTAGGPDCQTVFFINSKTGALATFFTSAPTYSESHGLRIGMPSGSAERLLHRRLFEGCDTNIYLSTARASLTIAFTGGHRAAKGTVLGAHVSAFVLHSRRSDAGVFDCL